MNKLSILALALLPLSLSAAELPNVPVGPLDFNEVPTREAIRTILNGTDVLPEFKLPPAGTITAKNVKGPLPDVIKHLSQSVGFTYQYKDKVLTIAAVPAAKVASTDATNKTVVAPAEPAVVKPVVKSVFKIQLLSGKSVKSALSAACIANGYTLNWKGQDLFAKYDASFEEKSFEDAVNSLLVAVQTAGYISNKGKDIYVVVQ